VAKLLKLKYMKLAIGADHAGFELKEFIKSRFNKIEFIDKGCFSLDSVDYPDFAQAVSHEILSKNVELGILICGSANGISISANKYKGIRAAIAWLPEISSLARQHNDANILSLPARFITQENAVEIINAFLASKFEGGRHQGRVDKIESQM
jgi:ribose 5-phosphate isomerase B